MERRKFTREFKLETVRLPSRSRAGISRSRSGRKSRFFARRATQCGKSLAGSGGQRRRSHGSCGAMPPLEAVVWSIARRQRNSMPSEPLAGQSRGSLRSTRHCEPMWRNDWLASSSLRAGLLCPAQPCPGKAVDMDGTRPAICTSPRLNQRRSPSCRGRSGSCCASGWWTRPRATFLVRSP
jgi:hypothetical protein